MRRSDGPALETAADRISAYVYGNILLLAAMVVLSRHDVESGAGFAIVAGTALSTFVAHTFAERLGSSVRGADQPTLPHILRDSVPILSSAAVPVALMALGATELIAPDVCLWVADAWIVARLALMAFIVGRLQGRPVTIGTWIASLVLALVALVVVAIKVVLTH